MHNITKQKYAACLVGLSLLAACAGSSSDRGTGVPVERNAPLAAYHRVALTNVEASEQTVALTFERGTTSAPRVLEVFLRATPNLKLAHGEAGEALIAAGKQAVFRQTDDGLIRVVAYSASNTETLDTGVLAELEFERIGAGAAQVEIVPGRPLLAPAGANTGLEIGDPIKL